MEVMYKLVVSRGYVQLVRREPGRHGRGRGSWQPEPDWLGPEWDDPALPVWSGDEPDDDGEPPEWAYLDSVESGPEPPEWAYLDFDVMEPEPRWIEEDYGPDDDALIPKRRGDRAQSSRSRNNMRRMFGSL